MQKNSTAPNNKAFAGLSRKAAGSQGRALSRAPQSAKLPFDFRFCENQPKRTKKARPQTRNTLRTKCAHGKDHPKGWSFQRISLAEASDFFDV